MLGITLRHSAAIEDPNLPGGTATGKVAGYTFSLDGDNGARETASVTIKCMIGLGGSVSAVAASIQRTTGNALPDRRLA